MKRLLALLLPTAILLALLVPVALAEHTEATPPMPARVFESEIGESSPPPQTELQETAVRYAPAPNQSSYVKFEDLPDLLHLYNSNVQSLNSTIKELNQQASASDSAAITGLMYSVNDCLTRIGECIPSVTIGDETAEVSDLDPVFKSLSTLLKLQLTSLQSQAAQLEGAKTTIQTTKNTLYDSIHQISKGAETLYIAIVTMEAAEKDAQRGIETLDRAVALVEKQHELGMASAYDVESIRHQRSAVQSQLESLQYQIKTSKITLEGMLGMELNGTVTLAPLTMPTAEDLSKIDYARQVTTASDRNVDVENAWIKDDGSKAAGHTYDGAMETFAYKFKLVCLNVPEQQRLVDAAQKTLDFQQRTFEIAAKKYELGMLSHEEYLSAENDVRSAESSLFSAQLNLFTAYRNYEYAYQYGIV